MEGINHPSTNQKNMKDFILFLCFLGSGINLIIADQVSDFTKCVYLFFFLIAIALWLVFTKQGMQLVKLVDDYIIKERQV